MSRSSGGVGLGVLNRAVHQVFYLVHYLLIFNCFSLSVSGVQGRPRNLPRCSPGFFLAWVQILSTEIVQQGQLHRTWRQVAQKNRGGSRNSQIRRCWSSLAGQAARRAQEVAQAHVGTPAVYECIHMPLVPSVCLG